VVNTNAVHHARFWNRLAACRHHAQVDDTYYMPPALAAFYEGVDK